MRWALAVGVVAACTGDVAIEDLDGRFAQAVCKARVRCELAYDLASCLSVAGTYVPASTVQLVTAGTIGYDPHLGGRCVSRVENAPCDEQDPAVRARVVGYPYPPYAPSDPCDTMFSGATGRGGSCASAMECAGPPRFAFPFDERCLNGRCTDSVGADATCGSDLDCQAGLYCGAQRCVPQQPVGAPCSGDACAFPSVCNAPVCVAGDALTAATGEACGAGVACADLRDYCNNAAKCARVVTPGGDCSAGQHCVDYAACTAGSCVTCPNAVCMSGGW